MFKLDTSQGPVKWPVEVHKPADGGATHRSKFTAHFVVLTQAEIARYSGEGDEVLMTHAFVGWEGVTDPAGDSIPFTPEARDAALQIPYVKTAVFSAYFDCINGRGRKN